MSTEQYQEFLNSKTTVAVERGAEFQRDELNPILLPHQGDLALWAARGGNRAIFASFGLGKTLIQIQLAHMIVNRHPKRRNGRGHSRSLQVCPLGVKGEFHRDSLRFFGTEIQYVRSNDELKQLSK